MDNSNPASWSKQDVLVTPKQENQFPFCNDFIIESNALAIPNGIKQANINVTSHGLVNSPHN